MQHLRLNYIIYADYGIQNTDYGVHSTDNDVHSSFTVVCTLFLLLCKLPQLSPSLMVSMIFFVPPLLWYTCALFLLFRNGVIQASGIGPTFSVLAWTAWLNYLQASGHVTMWIYTHHCLFSRTSNSLGFSYPIKFIRRAHSSCTCNPKIHVLAYSHVCSVFISVQCSTHFVNQTLFICRLLTCLHSHTTWSNLIIAVIELSQLDPWLLGKAWIWFDWICIIRLESSDIHCH